MKNKTELETKMVSNIKQIMKNKKVTQKSLAVDLGFSYQMVSLLLSGQRKLNLGHVESICKSLDVEVFELIV